MAHGSLLLSECFLVTTRKNVQPEIQTTPALDGCCESIRLRGDAQGGVSKEAATELKTQSALRPERSQKESEIRFEGDIRGRVQVRLVCMAQMRVHCKYT